MAIRFLHLADTHLGARHPGRGDKDPYLGNFRRAVAPALRGEVDVVFHGGDLFHRSRPPSRRLFEAAAVLMEVAKSGAEVVIVPGNHERALVPCRMLLAHRRIHLVDRPRCVTLRVEGVDLAIFGFPFLRKDPEARFLPTLLAAGWPGARGDVNVLLCHQTFDGATVGPAGYRFRLGRPDVIPRRLVPPGFDYLALGHIHRHQFLEHPRRAELLFAYPGSPERTSRAERFEEKGFLRGEFRSGSPPSVRFVALPTRPVPP